MGMMMTAEEAFAFLEAADLVVLQAPMSDGDDTIVTYIGWEEDDDDDDDDNAYRLVIGAPGFDDISVGSDEHVHVTDRGGLTVRDWVGVINAYKKVIPNAQS